MSFSVIQASHRAHRDVLAAVPETWPTAQVAAFFTTPQPELTLHDEQLATPAGVAGRRGRPDGSYGTARARLDVTKLPSPPGPATLRHRAPIDGQALRVLDPGVMLWRIHHTIGPHVLAWNALRFYGPAAGRFDPQPPSAGPSAERGVMYAAVEQVAVTVAEVFQRTRRVDVTAGGPWLTGLHLNRPVSLLDLSGGWPTQAGASQTLCSGPGPRAQAWARAITDAWPDLEGLWYPSAMLGGGHCVALWTPAADVLPTEPARSMPLAHPAFWDPLAMICEQIGYRLG